MASFRSALRQVQRVPNVRAVAGPSSPLERVPGEADIPHLMDAEVVEDATLRVHSVPGRPVATFRAFLDGVQESQLLAWSGVAPIVYGVVGAVVRRRAERRLATWLAPRIERRIYAPLAHTAREAIEQVFDPRHLVDTAPPDADGTLPPAHPTLLLERARLTVSRDRERAERTLAEQWCDTCDEPILIDGGIGGGERLARAQCAVGVVKSHRTLYVSGSALETVLALRRGERSSVIRVSPRRRSAVHSWYLRLRDGDAHDAFFGLVRIEVSAGEMDVGPRADEVSRWVLAESAPLATPDSRWDRMAYGIRSCESYLRAIT